MQLQPESCIHPLSTIRMQIPSAPEGTAIGLKLLRGLLENLDHDCRILLTLKPGADHNMMNSLIEQWGQSPNRLTYIGANVDSLFAQDNAITLQGSNGHPIFLLPRSNNRLGISKLNSRLNLEKAYSIKFRRSKLFWDGGNIAWDGNHCLIGANCVAQNMVQLDKSCDQVIEGLSTEFGCPVTILGDLDEAVAWRKSDDPNRTYRLEGGQADFHIDLDICLLGKPSPEEAPLAAIASCEVDYDLLDQILETRALFDHHFLPPAEMKAIYLSNLGSTMGRRKPYMDGYRQILEALGYRCIEIPDFRLSPDHNNLGRTNFCFNYINVVPAYAKDSGPTCYYLAHHISKIDRAAHNAYAKAGINLHATNQVDPVISHEIFKLRGGLHCATSRVR